MRGEPSVRREAWDDLSPVAAIDTKVGIRGKQHGIRQSLRHSDKASIGEAHWDVRVFSEKVEDAFEVFLEMKCGNHSLAFEQIDQLRKGKRPEDVECFGENRFAGFPGQRRP